MLKILHTADWHLGQTFYKYDREDEHRHFFSQLAQMMSAHQPDALVVSGDIFHTPLATAQAQRLLIDGILMAHQGCPTAKIVVIAGNHDSGLRLGAQKQLWRIAQIDIVGTYEYPDEGDDFDASQFIFVIPGKGQIVAVPYFMPANFPLTTLASKEVDKRQCEFFATVLAAADKNNPHVPTVLMSHMAVKGCMLNGRDDGVIGGELSTDLAAMGSGYDYLALGHIHAPQTLGTRARYSGSPIPVSFSEEYQHSVSLVEIDGKGSEPVITELPLQQLRNVITLEPDDEGVEAALEALAEIDDNADVYVRVHVNISGPLPTDAETRAAEQVQHKRCRLCQIRPRPRHKTQSRGSVLDQMQDIEDIKEMDPLKLADEYYRLKYNGDEMPQALQEMLKMAINDCDLNNTH